MQIRVIQCGLVLCLAGCLRIEQLELVASDAGADVSEAGAMGSGPDSDGSDAGSASAADAAREPLVCRRDTDCSASDSDAGSAICAPDSFCLERRDAFGATVVATVPHEIRTLVSDGETLYWMTEARTGRAGDPRPQAELWRMAPGGGPGFVAGGLDQASVLRLYGDYAYWSGISSGLIQRMRKTHRVVEKAVYAFEGCHNFVLDEDRLLLVLRTGVFIGSPDGSAPLEKVADISAWGADHADYQGDCTQLVALEGGEVFHKRDRALVATRLDSGEQREILPDFSMLIDVRDGYLYELRRPDGPFSVFTASSEFLTIRRDLSSGEEVLLGTLSLPEPSPAFQVASIDAELRDGYVYHFLHALVPELSGVRMWAARGFASTTDDGSVLEPFIPLAWEPRGAIEYSGLHTPPPHALTADGYYVALPSGSGSVLYRFDLPAQGASSTYAMPVSEP